MTIEGHGVVEMSKALMLSFVSCHKSGTQPAQAHLEQGLWERVIYGIPVLMVSGVKREKSASLSKALVTARGLV